VLVCPLAGSNLAFAEQKTGEAFITLLDFISYAYVVSVYRSNILCCMYCVINNGFIFIVPLFLVRFPLSEVGLYLICKSFLELTVLPKHNVICTLNTPQTSDN